MKTKITFLAVVLMAVSPVLAGSTVSDDYSADTSAYYSVPLGTLTISGGIANLSSGGQVAAAIQGQTSGMGMAAATVYVTPTQVDLGKPYGDSYIGNDSGVLLRANGTTFESYALNYDPVLDKLQLIYNQPGMLGYANMEGIHLGGGTYGEFAQTTAIRFGIVEITSGDFWLIGQAYTTGGAFMANVQCEVNGVITYDDDEANPIAVPALGSGYSGLYAQMNGNEYTNLGIAPSAVDSDFDNYSAQTSTLRGDANLDGVVNDSDFALLGANYGTGDNWHNADFNFDSDVNDSDFALLSGNYGVSGAAPTGYTPEPTTMGLLAVGGVLALIRRRK